MFDTLSDDDLLRHYRADGNAACVGVLFRRYRHLCLGVCVKYLKDLPDSEDALMEIFEQLHLSLRTAEVAHFKSWLYTVSRNHCLMRLRKAGLSVVFPDILPESSENTLENVAEEDWKTVLVGQLEKNLAQLKTEQREAITLFYLQEKSYKQIVEIQHWTLLEVKTHIQNGKSNLRKMMQKQIAQSE